MNEFQDRLEIGRQAELAIEAYFRKEDWFVEYKARMTGKPCANSLADTIILPDLFIFKEGKGPFAVEVKSSTSWSWNTFHKQFQIGIVKRQFNDYLKYQKLTKIPVWIYYLCAGGIPKHCDKHSPKGLFCAEVSKLIDVVDNDFIGNDYFPPSYYWNHDKFFRVAEYEDII